MEGFLTSEQLAARLGVQRDSIYRMHTRGDLPKPEHVGRTPMWPIAAIEAWEKNRPGHGWRKGKTKQAPAAE